MRGDKIPRSGGKEKIPLLPNNVGKKSTNHVGPQQTYNRVMTVYIGQKGGAVTYFFLT